MKKRTLGIILNVFNVILVIMIVMLIIMIGKRGAKPVEEAKAEDKQETTVVASDQTVTQIPSEPVAEPEPEEEATKVLFATPNVEDSLSVRAGDGTNFDKIGSAFPGETFEVLEVGASWSKVNYRGQEGYMSNAYLKFFYEVTSADGVVTRESVEVSELTN